MGIFSSIRNAWPKRMSPDETVAERESPPARIMVRGSAQNAPWIILIEASTRAVLAASKNSAAIMFLNNCTLDSYYSYNVARWSPRNQLPFEQKYDSLAHWTWNVKTRSFSSTRKDILTEALQERSRLAIQKLAAFNRIMYEINVARLKLQTGFNFQETIYLTKKMQAQAFKDGGCDESRAIEYPYVLHYADYAGISLRSAADDILLKAKLADEVLAKTELLRLTYLGRLRRAERLEDIPPILADFEREAFINAFV